MKAKPLATASLIKSMAALALLPGIAACSLKSGSTSSVYITMPTAGLQAEASARSLVSSLGLDAAASSTDVNGETIPTSLADFSCFAVLVTGDGIDPDPRWAAEGCRAKAAGQERLVGILAGLAPTSGGGLSVSIPTGSRRLIQLLGLKSTVGCPSLDEVLARPGGTDDGFDGIERPYELAQAQIDVFADQTLAMKAQFTPGQLPALECDDDHRGGTTGGPAPSGPLAIVLNQTLPTTSTAGTHVRVLGQMSGSNLGNPTFGIYSDANCTVLRGSQWMGARNGAFSVEADMDSANDTAIYVQASRGSETTPCLFAGPYAHDPSYPQARITGPQMGIQLSNGDNTLNLSGTCTPSSTGAVTVRIAGGSPISCGNCMASIFSCNGLDLSPYADGLIDLAVTVTASALTSDDTILVFKDALAPGLTVSSPNPTISRASASAVSISGACTAIGYPVEIRRFNGTTSDLLGTTTCMASIWTTVVNLSALPDGPNGLDARHYGPSGPSHDNHAHINAYITP